jgi:hypothetical protein
MALYYLKYIYCFIAVLSKSRGNKYARKVYSEKHFSERYLCPKILSKKYLFDFFVRNGDSLNVFLVAGLVDAEPVVQKRVQRLPAEAARAALARGPGWGRCYDFGIIFAEKLAFLTQRLLVRGLFKGLTIP